MVPFWPHGVFHLVVQDTVKPSGGPAQVGAALARVEGLLAQVGAALAQVEGLLAQVGAVPARVEVLLAQVGAVPARSETLRTIHQIIQAVL